MINDNVLTLSLSFIYHFTFKCPFSIFALMLYVPFYYTSQKHKASVYYLGATDPRLHSNSSEGRTDGFRTAERMTLRAIRQLFSSFWGKTGERSPKAIVVFDPHMAGSRKGSSISTRKRILCFTSCKKQLKSLQKHLQQSTKRLSSNKPILNV